jgi:CheY-like chemotaxis protein
MIDLKGLRTLVVEDEGAVALLIEDMLLELGCEIAASAGEFGKASELARSANIDFAVLDLNLQGVSALPIAQILRERRIPFVFSTGYGTSGVPQDFDSYPILAKPFVMADLQGKVRVALGIEA